MADPRADIGWTGIGAEFAPYKIDNSTITYDATQPRGTAQAGLAVTLSAAKTVALAADGQRVIGKLISVESDNLATVQIGGFMTLPAGTGAALTLGKAIVGALLSTAKGYIREAASGTAAELVLCGGVIEDAGATSAVWVYLP